MIDNQKLNKKKIEKWISSKCGIFRSEDWDAEQKTLMEVFQGMIK